MTEKILPRNLLADRLVEHRRNGDVVVFTNGCFDILHAGHVRYLAAARRLGSLLVVGLNSDGSVRGLKGPLRPIMPEADRAELLAALAAVDYVTIFDEPTPAALIAELHPDVLVKGRDYEGKEVVGTETVEADGGRVILVDLVEGRGTTNVIQTIVDRYGKGTTP